jgi:hypothetical protein
MQLVSDTNISCLKLFREVIAIYSDNQMKAINALCEKTQLLIVKAGG